ncbi:hypothetical protein AVEN_182372-1 [Araneus ventricosus]|uniref:Uncharacterized protein n=1 Tax=Araneus ventricosus TaxID=182803 RepID=A0A4Y2NPB0_ARAVE|nr:hypothetical protein AVEN_182372-1 [Araneus ventricosus]
MVIFAPASLAGANLANISVRPCMQLHKAAAHISTAKPEFKHEVKARERAVITFARLPVLLENIPGQAVAADRRTSRPIAELLAAAVVHGTRIHLCK